jgi:hypothetical protein
MENSNPLYRFEYAIRGNMRDIPPDRKLAYTESSWKGFIKKKINSIKWAIPPETNDSAQFQIDGAPPKFGEIWEEGPHRALVNHLNEDSILTENLKDLIQRINKLVKFTIYSDKWKESIRFSCSVWSEREKALELYVSAQYLDIAQRVLGHTRRVRRQFGGLTF